MARRRGAMNPTFRRELTRGRRGAGNLGQRTVSLGGDPTRVRRSVDDAPRSPAFGGGGSGRGGLRSFLARFLRMDPPDKGGFLGRIL